MVDYKKHTAIHIWCPLTDVDQTNGCLWAVAGSHRFFNHIVALTSNPAPYNPVRKLLEEEYSTPVPMSAGSIFIFDQRLLHWSDENRTDALRIAVGGIMIPEGVSPFLYMWEKEDPERLTVLEVSVDYLTQFKPGVLINKPYPSGVKFIKTIPYKIDPITADQISFLKPVLAKRLNSHSLGEAPRETVGNGQPSNCSSEKNSSFPDLMDSFSLKRNRWFDKLNAWLRL